MAKLDEANKLVSTDFETFTGLLEECNYCAILYKGHSVECLAKFRSGFLQCFR